jgi:hypothetical protein
LQDSHLRHTDWWIRCHSNILIYFRRTSNHLLSSFTDKIFPGSVSHVQFIHSPVHGQNLGKLRWKLFGFSAPMKVFPGAFVCKGDGNLASPLPYKGYVRLFQFRMSSWQLSLS